MKDKPTGTVLLDPANPHDFTQEELEDLAGTIREDEPQLEIIPVLRDEEGYGGPLSEVLHVWIQIAESVNALAITAAIAQRCVVFLRKRWEADRMTCSPAEEPRKRVFDLYDENDRLVREVVIDLPDGVPEDREIPSDAGPLPHPRPRPGAP